MAGIQINRSYLGRAIALIVLLCVCFGLQAQQGNKERAREVMNTLKGILTYGYSFTIQAQYPDGSKDKLDGESYVDGAKRILFNRSEAYTMLYSDKWYYRADHQEKTINIVNISKHYSDKNKLIGRDDLFAAQLTSEFIDSLVLKYGTVQSFKQKGDTVNIVFVFPEKIPVKKLELSFDMGRKLPVRMELALFYPSQEEGENGRSREGIAQVVRCHDYKKNIAAKQLDFDSYFTLSNGKVALKQYTGYKLYSLL